MAVKLIKNILALFKSNFFRWWFIFSSLYSLSATCPCCGRQGCPVGLGVASLLGLVFTFLVNFFSRFRHNLGAIFSRVFCACVALAAVCVLSSCATAPVSRQAQPVRVSTWPQPAPAARGDVFHTVAPGETLWRISKMYDVSASSILRANNLVSQEPVLKKGQRLLIPGASAIVPVISLYPSKKWRYIIIHHSATDEGNSLAFDKAHLDRGWKGLGYHFVIDNGSKGKKDGQIEVSPRWLKQEDGSHCKAGGMNSRAIGICLVGNFNHEQPTRKQMESLAYLVNKLKRYYNIPARNILGHGQVKGASTDCPGKMFPWHKFRSMAE
jgi:LysM repeat protein